MSDINQLELMYRNELEERKNNIRKAQESVVTGLIKIGYELKKIKIRQLYKYAGYEDFNEFVLQEFKMERTAASKMMKLNDTYSEGGYSEQIKEGLEEKLSGLGKSLLIEMTSLPEEDYELVTPGMGVKDIRPLINAENELKEEEKREKEQLQGQTSLINNFPETVPDSEKPKKEQPTISDVIRELFHPRDMKERLDALVNMDPDSSAMEWWIDDFTRSMKVFSRPPFFLYFHEKEVKIKNVPEKTIETKSYKNFYFMVRAAFHQETAKGTDVWYQAFGEEWEQQKEEEKKQEELRKKAEAEKKKPPKKKPEEKKEPESAQSLDFNQCEAVSETPKKEPETTEIRSEEPEIVTGEVENTVYEGKKEVCDTAQNVENIEYEGDSGNKVWCNDKGIPYLKVSECYHEDITSRKKRFSIRYNDRDYKEGDEYILVFTNGIGILSYPHIHIRITYVLNSFKGLADGYIAFGYEVIDNEE